MQIVFPEHLSRLLPPDHFPPALRKVYGAALEDVGALAGALRVQYLQTAEINILEHVPENLRCAGDAEYAESLIQETCSFYTMDGDFVSQVLPQVVMYSTRFSGDLGFFEVTQKGSSVGEALQQIIQPVYGILYCQFLLGEPERVWLFVTMDGGAIGA